MGREPGLKLLLVEDEPDMRDILTDLLTEEGWNVITTPSIRTARNLLNESNWSCILMDLHLSDGTADELRETLQKVRRNPHPLPTVILMTGVPDSPEQYHLDDLIDSFLLKPFSISDLLRIMPPSA